MSNQLLLLFVAGMAAWSSYKFFRKRESPALLSALFWAVLAWRIVAPSDWLIPVLGGLLLLQVVLRRQPVWRARADMMIWHASLPRLSHEQRRQRANLTPDERASIYVDEGLFGKRLTPAEVTEALRRRREMDEESRAHKERERQRLLEEELEREKEREEARQLEVTPISEPMPIRFKVTEASTFPASTGGELSISPGEYEGTLLLRAHEIEESDGFSTAAFEVEFTFRDQSARTWKNTAILVADVPLSLERLASLVPQPEARFWRDSDPVFQHRFNERCMVAKLLVSDDGRSRFPLLVGGRQIVIMTKYLSWRVDVAMDEDQRRVWVRVSQLTEEICEGEDENAEFVDISKVDPFYYALPVEEFLPITRRNRFELGLDEIGADAMDVLGPEYYEARRKVIVFNLVEG